jgi:hypothetical protein
MSTLKDLLATTLATTVGLAVVAVGTPAPAYADPGTVQVSSGPGVIFEECADHPVSYSVSPSSDVWSWHIDLVLQAPDGTAGGSATVTSSQPTTGVEMVRFCGSSHLPGTYTVTGTYKTFAGMSMTSTPVTPFTIEMRKPLSSVTARASDRRPRRGQVVKVKVRVADERPTGALFPTAGAKVVLQRKVGARWVKVRGAKGVTRDSGVVQVRFTHGWRGKTRFRAFANLGYVGRTASPSFVLRTRR